MEFLGVGPLELFFILLIALIILGPRDMAKAGRTIGRFLRRTILSPTWIDIQRKIRTLPNHLMREAGIEEDDLRIEGLKLNEPSRRKVTSSPQTIAKPATTQPQLGQRPDSLAVPTEWTSQPPTPPASQPAIQSDEPPAEWTTQPAEPPSPAQSQPGEQAAGEA